MNPPQQTDPPKCPICCGGLIPQVLLTQPVCVAWFCEKQIYFKIDGNNARLPMLWPSTNPGYGPSSTLTDIWFCTARWLIFPILTISCCNHCSLRMLYLLPPDQQPKPDSFSVHQVQGQKLNSSEYIPMCNRFSNGRPWLDLTSPNGERSTRSNWWMHSYLCLSSSIQNINVKMTSQLCDHLKIRHLLWNYRIEVNSSILLKHKVNIDVNRSIQIFWLSSF